MLIFSCRPAETLCIGDDITVSVLHVNGNQVRLGIHAPDSFPIYMKETYLAIKAMEEKVVKKGPNPIAPRLIIDDTNKE